MYSSWNGKTMIYQWGNYPIGIRGDMGHHLYVAHTFSQRDIDIHLSEKDNAMKKWTLVTLDLKDC
jgi:hypothetical protein